MSLQEDMKNQHYLQTPSNIVVKNLEKEAYYAIDHGLNVLMWMSELIIVYDKMKELLGKVEEN